MKNYFRVVKLMFTADKKLLIKSISIVILFLVMESLIPIYMQWMISQTEQNKSIQHFVLYVALFVIAYLVLCLIDAVRAETNEYLGKHILWETRKKIYNVLWHGDYFKVLNDNREKYKFILTNETYLIYAVTSVYTINIVINLVTVVLFLLTSFSINPYIAVILLASFFVTLSLSFYTGKKILANYEKCDNAKEADAIINNENVDMVEVIRTNGLMTYYMKKNKKALDSFIETAAKSDRTEIFWMDIERAIHYIIYVLIAGVLIISSEYNSGELVTILFITNYLLEQSQAFQHQLQVIIKNIPVFDKVMNSAEISTASGIEVKQISSITFDAVSLSYSKEREIFSNLSFEIHKGDNVLIEGVNGSGKSSVLKMIAGLLLPTSGTIKINERNLNEYNRQNLYREICYISQDELLLNETVENYLRVISHSSVSDDYIAAIKQKVMLNTEINNITDNGRSLSGGEKKKLLMMKSLLCTNVSVVVLDEIDAGLDAETKAIMHQLEKELLADERKIVIKISHIDTDKRGFNKIIQI